MTAEKSARLYDALLRCYPRAYRERFGHGMRGAFAAELADAPFGAVHRARFWLVTVAQALWFGSLEHLPKGPFMSGLGSFFKFDFRDAFRSLRATPVITLIALASLGLGIGANTALFSILNGLVLKPLPVREPERLALIDESGLTNAIWEQIRPHGRALFDGAFAWSGATFDLADAGVRDPVNAAYAGGDMFDVLGITATLGRTFTSADDVRGGGPDGAVAVISDGFWRRRFGGSPAIVGRKILLNRTPFTVIGVLPAGFFGMDVGSVADVIVPLEDERIINGADSILDNRSSWWLSVYLRRKPGQSIEQASAALESIRPAIREGAMPQDWPPKMQARFVSEPLKVVDAATGQSPYRARYAQPLTIVMAVVGAVLLIACANIANLLMARASGRRGELSLRLALGASRLRVGRQLLAESILLGVGGTALGLLIANFGSRLLVNQLTTSVNRVIIDLGVDWRVLGFTTGVALATTILFGLAPAFSVTRLSPGDALKEQSRSVTGDRRFGLRSALVVLQLALSLALVVGAGLFMRTFASLTNAPVGFDPAPLTVAYVTMGRGASDDAQRFELARQFVDAASHVPGIERAAVSAFPPLSGVAWNDLVVVRDGVELTGRQRETWVNAVSPGWFATYGMRLLSGRDFESADTDTAPKVVIVNEAFVARFIGNGPAVGRVVLEDGGSVEQAKQMRIVGVVSDSLYRSVRQGIVPVMYMPFLQGGPAGQRLQITLRLAGAGGAAVERGVAAALARVDPQALFNFRPLTDMLRGTYAAERITALLSGFFGALALLLAGLGLYGVTSYSVNRRRSEIAIRMALGASSAGVVKNVLGRVTITVASGVVLGGALSWWASKFVARLLFGLPARDSATLATAAAVLVATGLIAGWLPARRAARLDPTIVLRD